MSKTKQTLQDEATVWLKAYLSRGPIEVNEIMRSAAQQGFGWRTVERAKQMLGIKGVVTHQWIDPGVTQAHEPESVSHPETSSSEVEAYAPDWTAEEATQHFIETANHMRLKMGLEDQEIESELVADWSRFKQPISRADIARIARS